MTRSLAHSPIQRYRRLSGPGSKALSVGRGRLRRRHLEVRGPAGADPAVRSRQCHADPLQRPSQAQGLGLRDRQAINDAQGAHRSGSANASVRPEARVSDRPWYERNAPESYGVPKDYARALMWSTLAITRARMMQHESSRPTFETRWLAKNDPSQIAEAQRMAREWSPK
jgi:hypothetical protein